MNKVDRILKQFATEGTLVPKEFDSIKPGVLVLDTTTNRFCIVIDTYEYDDTEYVFWIAVCRDIYTNRKKILWYNSTMKLITKDILFEMYREEQKSVETKYRKLFSIVGD